MLDSASCTAILREMAKSPALYPTSVCVAASILVGIYWMIQQTKKRRLYGKEARRPHAQLATLNSFECKEVLKDEDDGRVVTLLGRFAWQAEEEVALVKLTATPLPFNGLSKNLGRLVLHLKNDSGAEYAFYDGSMPAWTTFVNDFKASSYSLEVVAPASEKVVNRHRPVATVMWTETPEMYATVTEAYVEKILTNEKSLSWLYNVLSKEREADRVLYEDDDEEHGFLMNVDTKWRTHPNVDTVPREQWRDHPSVTDLYCLAICQKRGIRTLRDLRATHLPMLREIYTRGVKTVGEVYGVSEDQLRVFVHYIPQFFHFHVHFTRLNSTIGVEVERAHLLLDIIQNLEMDSDFYETRTMQYRLRENDALHLALEAGEV